MRMTCFLSSVVPVICARRNEDVLHCPSADCGHMWVVPRELRRQTGRGEPRSLWDPRSWCFLWARIFEHDLLSFSARRGCAFCGSRLYFLCLALLFSLDLVTLYSHEQRHEFESKKFIRERSTLPLLKKNQACRRGFTLERKDTRLH